MIPPFLRFWRARGHRSPLRGWPVRLALVLAVLMGGGAPTVASAATCSATVSPMNFATLGFLSTAATTSSTIQVTCQRGLLDLLPTVQVCPLIGPSGGGGSGANRTLQATGGQPALRYGLYSDAARTTPWGDLTHQPYPSITLDLSSGSPVTQLMTVYGQVAASQTPYGNAQYVDAPMVTLAYGPLGCTLGAQTSIGPLNVTAMDLPTCTVNASPLNFGNQGLLQNYVDGTSSVQAACTAGTPYTITFGAGQGPGATPALRYMTNGTYTLGYTLYTNAARTTLWTDTQGVQGTGTGAVVSVPVYARIPAQSAPPPGVYNDQVVVTVTY